MKIQNGKRTFCKKNIIVILFVLITFSALLYRITLHADIYDEIINLSTSYRVALGQLPFYECWDSFQSGDIIIAPFLWIFIKIVGSTGGIILFSRMLYLCTLIFTGIMIYFAVNRYLDKRSSFFLGYLFCFFQLYGLFYLWYDSSSIILLTLGCIFTFRGLNEPKFYKLWFILAGMFHGLMAFSYPTYALLAVFYAILLLIYLFKTSRKEWTKILFYLSGGMLVVIAFLLYVFSIIGINNFITGIEIILSYRSISTAAGSNLLYNVISSYLNVNSWIILPTIILVFLFHKSLKQDKYTVLFIVGILSIAFINQITIEETMKGLGNFMAYLALWAPCFYLLKKKRGEKRKNTIIYFLWLPSILSSLCISALTVYAKQGPIKCWQGFILAGIVTIWLIYDYLVNSKFKFNIILSKLWIPIIICILLLNSYNYIYLNQPHISFSDKRMKEGIYKGIKVNSSMESLLEMQYMVLEYTKGKHTILAGNRLRPIYLMTDLLPCVPTTEGPCYYKDNKWHWEMTIKYFEMHGKYPDVMFLEPYEIESKHMQKLLKEKYNYIAEENIGEFVVNVYYIKN